MVDISKCKGVGCPLRERCYRYTASSSEYRQSWAGWTPTKVKNKWICDGFSDNRKYK